MSTRPPRLFLRFAILAGIVLALAGAAGTAVSRALATERAEEAVWTSARFAADDLARDDLARHAVDAPAGAELRAQLDELFARKALGPNVLAVALYDREGRVTYATAHSLIGTVPRDWPKVAAALAGDRVRGTADVAGRRVLESYVPVRWLLSDTSFPNGVLRVTTDYAPVAAEIADDTRAQGLVLVLALALLYLSLFPILRGVTRRLARSEASYRALTQQASDAILVTDAGGTIVEANEGAHELLGASTIAGRAFEDLVDADELRRDPLRIDDVAAGLTLLRERTFRRDDGSAVVGELHAKRLADGRILVAVRDATARKEAEQGRSRLAAMAQRAEGTARLAAGAAHDFSGLLAEIAGNSDLMLARLPARDPLRATAERIQDAAARGSELTRQLSAFGGRPETRPQVLDAQAVLERLEPQLRRLVGGTIAVVCDVQPRLGSVEADPRQLEQVVVGLVLNAEAAMPAGGTITVSAASVDFARRRRAPSADTRVTPGSYVMIAVTDEGADGGDVRLGLELASVFALVGRGGGTIGVEAEPGRGTTIRVYLPRVDAPIVRAGEPRTPPPARAGAGETVLVVEDEVVVRALVREILEEDGYRVVEAAGGRDALALLEEGHAVELVLTDVAMPDLGGLELAEEVARLLPGCPVIAMSGSAAEAREGVRFLQKPFTHETLTRAVRDALDLPQPALV
jgi:PAS domain S-box-containing protein